jgi:hypothetical protein
MNFPSLLRHWFTFAAAAISTWLVATLTLSADDAAALADALGKLVEPLIIIVTLVAVAAWRIFLTKAGTLFRKGAGEDSGGSGGGLNLLWLVGMTVISTAAVVTLPSCNLPAPSGAEYPVRGFVTYTDPQTGAQVGFQVGEPPKATKPKKAKAPKIIPAK